MKANKDMKIQELINGWADIIREEYMMSDESGYCREMLLEMGINIDPDKHTVEFTDAHEDGVDTSLKEPTIDTSTIPGVSIYSIFQRNDALMQDGNPLISALKGNVKDGWVISDENKERLMKRIKEIINLFCKTHPMDITIVLPSGGNINHMLRDMVENIMKQYKSSHVILDNVIVKMTTEEVEEEMGKSGSAFNKEFNTAEKRRKAWEKLRPSFERMDKENGGVFSYKMVRPPIYRKQITKALRFTDNQDLKDMISKMPDKDILIIDDTVTFGNTTRAAVNLVMDTVSNIKSTAETIGNYAPKSISVLTLFSVKQYKDR